MPYLGNRWFWATENCTTCGEPLGIDYDGDRGLAFPEVEEIDAGFRCEDCQKVVHSACSVHSDVCHACCLKHGGCELTI